MGHAAVRSGLSSLSMCKNRRPGGPLRKSWACVGTPPQEAWESLQTKHTDTQHTHRHTAHSQTHTETHNTLTDTQHIHRHTHRHTTHSQTYNTLTDTHRHTTHSQTHTHTHTRTQTHNIQSHKHTHTERGLQCTLLVGDKKKSDLRRGLE